MRFHTLLTHESPDLDAMLSILLMREFGEEKFPGVSEAEVQFVSANSLPEGKTTESLEAEGILPIDIGGGRFDTHPVGTSVDESKRQRSASDLVAEELGVIYDERWAPLVEYARMQDTTGHSLFSKDYLHHLVSIHTILLGLEIQHAGDSSAKLEAGIDTLRNIPHFVTRRDKQFNIQELLLQFIERYTIEHPADPELPADTYRNFSRWLQRLEQDPKRAFARHELDELVSLKSIAIGAFYRFEKDREQAYKTVELCLDAILTREEQWARALLAYEKQAESKRIGQAYVTHIESENGMVIKAARFKNRGDLILYRDPRTGATSILRKHRGPLQNFSLRDLAAKVRLAETSHTKEAPDFDLLTQEGTVHGWFLHQSGNLLIKGSPKATDFEPSQIPLTDLAQIAYYQIGDYLGDEAEYNLPGEYLSAYLEFQKYQLKKRFG